MKRFDNLTDYEYWRLKQNQIAFVPTMGNLHEGHLSLIEKAKELADTVVVSIFVNPLQFAAHEDLSSYPRTLEEDFKKLSGLLVSAVLVPQSAEMYPEDTHQQTQVIVPEVSKGLCGDSRPHFFQGVATVVCKLFNIVKPTYAVFGEKDYQQLLVIKKMVKDLSMPITVIDSPIIREANGLAMSSRNNYLSKIAKENAGKIYQTLTLAASEIRNGEDVHSVLQKNANCLEKSGFIIDYFELREEQNLSPLSVYKEGARLFIAVYIEKTRLIDNLKV